MRGLMGLFAIPTAIVLSFMLLPIVVVVGIAVARSPGFEFPPEALSLRWFEAFFSSASLVTAFFAVSLPLGLAVACVATVVGTLTAVGLTRLKLRGRDLFETALFLPIIFPQILLGVGLYLMYAQLHIQPGLACLGAAHVLIACPYVIRTVLAGLAGIDPRLEEAARNLGAHPARAFLLATLPLLTSSMVAGALFAFIISFGDINLALFLSGAGSATFPVLLLGEMEHAADPTIAAAASMQVLLVCAVLLAIQRMMGSFRL